VTENKSPHTSSAFNGVPYATRAAVIIDYADGTRETYILTGNAIRWEPDLKYRIAHLCPDVSFSFKGIEHLEQTKGQTP
jgi:hypothetical protein